MGQAGQAQVDKCVRCSLAQLRQNIQPKDAASLYLAPSQRKACHVHLPCRAGSTLPATAGVSTSASLVSACKMRCATLLLLLGPLRPADGVAAARHWLDAAQQPGEVR